MRAKLDSSGLDTGRHRAERDFNENPPEFEPAQGSGDGWNMDFGDSFGGGSSGGNNSLDPFGGLGGLSGFGSGTQDSAFSGSGGGSLSDVLNPNPQSQFNQQQQPQQRKMEDVAVDVAIKAGKAGWGGILGFVAEVKEAINDDFQEDLKLWAYYMSRGSIFMGVIGIMLLLLSFLLPGLSKDYSLSLIISAMVTFAFSIAYYMIKRDSFKKSEEVEEEGEGSDSEYSDELEESPEDDSSFNWDDSDSPSDFDSNDSEEDGFGDFNFDNWDEDTEDDNDSYDEGTKEIKNVDEALQELDSDYIPVERYTRAYLVETFCKVLPTITPGFSVMHDIPEDSDDFNDYDTYIYEICNRIGLPEEKIPKLISLRENLFIVQLKLDRPKGFNKEQVVADELAMAYKVDQDTGRPRQGAENVYATWTASGLNYFINLYVCTEAPLVSIGDIYKKDKEKILDVKNKMPFIWGVTELGDVVWSDLDNIDTLIISGVPRSGKSWKMQSILLQLCMFNSPEDVEFYLLDPKGTTSDYYNIRNLCPHFRCFRDTKESIIQELEKVTTVEKDKRSRLFAEKGVINIKDMHRRYPSEKVPYLYVIVDEMYTLVNSMTKDELNHFWELLGYIVTKMPNLGFRLICVPHRITNDYIKKSISNNIPNKVCIRATKSDVENGLDIKSKDFQYSLPNKGDMAVKSTEVNGGEPLYVHGEAICVTNEENVEAFRYVGEVWRRLLPNFEENRRGDNSTKPTIEGKKVNHDFVPQKEDKNAVDVFADYADEELSAEEEDLLSVDNIENIGEDDDNEDDDWNLSNTDDDNDTGDDDWNLSNFQDDDDEDNGVSDDLSDFWN